MKKLFLLFLLFATNVCATDFSPTPLTLSVQPQLYYKFDDSSLEIPFTLTGTNAAIWLVINTHGQADNIVNIRNGHLGWHYVNKIDTTIYISDRFEREPGESSIIWDGRDENGNKAEPGSYDYYLWGYDDRSDRELVCNYIRTGYNLYAQETKLYEKDEQGIPLSKPMLMGSFFRGDFDRYGDDIYRQGTQFKWSIGNNPSDKSLIQTSLCAMYYPQQPILLGFDEHGNQIINMDYLSWGSNVFDPKNHNIFYQTTYKVIPYETQQYSGGKWVTSLFKWEFVPNGEAILDSDWFGWDARIWDTATVNFRSNCIADDNYIYIAESKIEDPVENNTIKCISYDGELVFDKNFYDWFIKEDPRYTYMYNSYLDKLFSRENNKLFLLSSLSCMHQLINTSRLYEDKDDETEMVLFTNSNGDYFMDNGWQENHKYPWFCVASIFSYPEIYNDALKKTAVSIDSNDFNLIFVWNYGIASFGVSTQDGTGIGYMSFADDRPDKICTGGIICDSGSAYDGIYFSEGEYNTYWVGDSQTYYMAFDSAHGLITNNPAVHEQNPLQFKVAQNTPNPFNPSTTISFSIPEKSDVSIDIYNIIGQKIKTLINGPMSAGEHSVKWDAGGCSAGVYFYKVKAGKFEKTMRMTLVR